MTVEPSEYSGPEGETIQFICQAPLSYNIRWSREGRELPSSANYRGGILTIYNVAAQDSGAYVCTAFDPYSGISGDAYARVSVSSSSRYVGRILVPQRREREFRDVAFQVSPAERAD